MANLSTGEEISLETAPAVVWDAMIVPDGEDAADELSARGQGRGVEFLKDQYRHCKPISCSHRRPAKALALNAANGIPAKLRSSGGRQADVGLLQFDAAKSDAAVRAFIAALTKHRNFERETDPPRV